MNDERLALEKGVSNLEFHHLGSAHPHSHFQYLLLQTASSP